MEMERRETRGLGDVLQPDPLAEMGGDEIHRAVHAVDVVGIRKIWQVHDAVKIVALRHEEVRSAVNRHVRRGPLGRRRFCESGRDPDASRAEKRAVTGSGDTMTKQPTTLGAFSVSLAVKDLKASRAFYEKLDFAVVMGDDAQNWLILRNGTVTIGLFQGMFERNILTFNPGWDDQAQAVAEFTDVREHQRRLKSAGLELTTEADESGTGPASFMLIDPDGNPILLDQHVPRR